MVCILLADGFETIEALAPADILTRAGADVVLAALEGGGALSSHGIWVKAGMSLSEIDAEAIEMLVLPGGGAGTENLKKSPAVRALIEKTAERKRPVAAICAAPSLLADMGLLTGRRAVCFPSMQGELAAAGAQVEDASVVRDGPFITARAAGSSIAFGLTLAEVLYGPETAEKIRASICAD